MTDQPYHFSEVFVQLITPLAGSLKLGPSLRSPEDPDFKELKDMIALDSQYFRDGQGQPAVWQTVVEKSIELLSNKAKDLEVLAWLVRGLLKIQGLSGLRDGFMLLRTYHHEYWDEHRKLKSDDVGGINWCLGRMDWLNDKLETDINSLSIFDTSLLRTDESMDAMQLQQQAQSATSLSYYREQEALFKQTHEEYRWLVLALDQKYVGEGLAHPVSLSRAQARLQGRSIELEGLIAKKSSAGVTAKQVGTTRNLPSTEALAALPASRESALAMLGAAAEYLAQTEPLSPVPHLIRRAVRWSRGSLQDWLAEIIGHRSAELETIYQTLDMKQPEAGV